MSRSRRPPTVLLALVVVLAACSGDASGPTSSSSVSTSTAPGAIAPADTTITTITIDTTTITTTTIDTTTITATTTAPAEPVPIGETVLALPAEGLVAAAPIGDADWSRVGPGWLLLDHGVTYTEPVTLDRRGLYLVAPDDSIYAVSALPSDGSWIVAATDDGRRALLQVVDPVCADGCTCSGSSPPTVETDRPDVDDRDLVAMEYGYVLLDAVTRTLRPLIEPVAVPVCDPGTFARHVELTSDGEGIWVSEAWYGDDRGVMTRERLGRVDISTGDRVTVLDHTVERPAAPPDRAIGVIELDDDEIVTWSSEGIWRRRPDGTPIDRLDAPPASCGPLRRWDADHLLARCTVPADEHPLPPNVAAEECRTSGLWVIPTDGSPSRELAIPLDELGRLSCWAGYTDAERVDGWVAVQVAGDGCTDGVDLISDGGELVRGWTPPDRPGSCSERLLGVRNGAWLVTVEGDQGSAVYEVTVGSARRIDLPTGLLVPV